MTTIQPIEEATYKKRRMTKCLFLVTVVSSFGSLQYGYNLWVVYSPSVLLQDFYNVSYGEKSILNKDPNYTSFLTGVTIALFPLGGIVGSLLVGFLVDKYGRKGTLVINSFLSIIGAVLMGCVKVIRAYEFTMVTRLVIGICAGIFSTAIPMYLAEISPENLRGSIVMTPHLFLILGVLAAQILALREILGTHEGWPILMCLVGILALFQMIILPNFPESPRYLLIQKKDEEKARNALKKLRDQDDVENEMEEFRQEDLADKSEKQMNSLKLLCFASLRWQVISVIVLTAGQQLTGVNAAYFYTERIYTSTRIGLDNVRYISICSTALLILSISLGMVLTEVVGRRLLLLIGFASCALFGVLLCITIPYQKNLSWVAYLNTIFVDLFLCGQALGPASIPNVITAELFLQSSRSSGYVIGGFVHWFLYFLTGVTFLHVEDNLGSSSFLLFLPACIIAFIYTFKVVPETKNKSFLDIRRFILIQNAKRILVKSQTIG
ncbi:solute carrier family 2, facilitated glucose transporter member 5-like [Hemicordylus capensis]|uniref:solute carrier family 2, facilitated glucose transporter member 5-like n=1 Tax=Hemicordylus capensis TaxID=884348 RepID=UPI002304B7CE|nr:solute carrier family 2, facilitated glucose transporter member 5-like [Hemicordylus capensis]XP_053136759.1 solute carrier family 2, facilitated glucose transporter member 5-like [Hemicordylus capensis]